MPKLETVCAACGRSFSEEEEKCPDCGISREFSKAQDFFGQPFRKKYIPKNKR